MATHHFEVVFIQDDELTQESLSTFIFAHYDRLSKAEMDAMAKDPERRSRRRWNGTEVSRLVSPSE